jgi:hypothetical protein
MNYRLGLLGVSSVFLLLAGELNAVPGADRPGSPLAWACRIQRMRCPWIVFFKNALVFALPHPAD